MAAAPFLARHGPSGVIGPAGIAALPVHIMTNTALAGATYDIDGGQQLVPGGWWPSTTW